MSYQTPESKDLEIIAHLGSGTWDPDLLVSDLDPEGDPDPSEYLDIFMDPEGYSLE